MKKTLLTVLIIITLGASAFAQSNYNKCARFGFMIPLEAADTYSLYPFDLAFEYVFFNKSGFSIGGELGFYYGTFKYFNSTKGFGGFNLKPLVHYNFTKNFDAFTGFGLFIPVDSDSDLHWQFTVGGRYFFTNNFGAHLRAHFDNNWLELGVSYRF